MTGKPIAFIDIGTNSIRLLLAQYYGNYNYRILTQQKETTRLGEGEFGDNLLKPQAIQRAVLICKKFVELAQSQGSNEIIAVATSATRDAANQAEFLFRLKDEAGLQVRVISGREEARLIHLGITSGTNLGDKTGFFIDIGGGSTEVIIGTQNQHFYLDSLKLGAIRLTNLFLAEEKGPIRPNLYNLLQRQIRHTAVRTLQNLNHYPIHLAFGSSGTIENLAEITFRHFYKRKLQKEDLIPVDKLRETIQMLASLPLEERRKVPGINPERADIIIGGAAILDVFLEELNIAQFSVSDRALRDGLLIDYLSRSQPSEGNNLCKLREESVLRLAHSCGFNESHAQNVARLATQLFDSAIAIGLFDLTKWERELLTYAAWLHDIGAFLSYSNHHNHSFYLIRNADLLGFDQNEITIIALTALYHRKSLPRKKQLEFAALDKYSQKIVVILSMLLRLAESLDRSHTGSIDRVQFQKADSNTVLLAINNIRDCQLELWGIQNQTVAFREIFKKKLLV